MTASISRLSKSIFGFSISDKFFLIALFLVSLIVHHRWVFGNSIYTHGDWGYLDSSFLQHSFKPPEVWSGVGLGGPDIANLAFYPFNLIYSVLYRLFGLEFPQSSRLIFLLPSAFLPSLSAYVLFRKILVDKTASFIAALCYAYNPYFYILKNGHLTLMAAFSFAPVCLVFFVNLLKTKKIIFAFLAGLSFFIASFFEFRAFFLISLVCAGLLFFVAFREGFKVLNIFKYLILAALPFFLFVLIKAHWFVALFSIQNSASFLGRPIFGDDYMNVAQSMAGFHPFWAGDRLTAFHVQRIPVQFWLMGLFSLLGIYLNKKNSAALFFGFLYVVGIFLTKQSSEPFVDSYRFMYQHLPFFSAFRESSKFYFFLVLSQSALVGFLLLWLKTRVFKYSKFFANCLICFILFFSFYNSRGLITGSVGALFVPREIPTDYLALRNFIDQSHENSRALWVPHDSRWISSTPANPKVSLSDIYHSNLGSVLFDKSVTAHKTEGENLVNFFVSETGRKFFNVASVKYVIVPVQDVANDDNFYKHYGKPKSFYVDRLSRTDYLKRLNLFSQLDIFENKLYRSKLFLTDKDYNSFQNLNFKKLSDSRYVFNLQSQEGLNRLYFSESFHPQWRIFSGQPSLFEIVLNKAKPLPIPPNQTGENLIIWEADSLESNHTYTIYFLPQAKILIGWILSSFVLLVAILAVFALFIFKYVKKVD